MHTCMYMHILLALVERYVLGDLAASGPTITGMKSVSLKKLLERAVSCRVISGF